MCDPSQGDGDDLRDSEFAASIAAHVLGVLRQDHFFELLDDRFSPADPKQLPVRCAHRYENTLEILNSLGMDDQETADVLAVMRINGGCCDCEILYNVAEESRLKAKYWKASHTNLSHIDP